MAYYICGKCRFAFERVGKVDSCPDCAHPNVMEATGAEMEEYLLNRDEFSEEKSAIRN